MHNWNQRYDKNQYVDLLIFQNHYTEISHDSLTNSPPHDSLSAVNPGEQYSDRYLL